MRSQRVGTPSQAEESLSRLSGLRVEWGGDSRDRHTPLGHRSYDGHHDEHQIGRGIYDPTEVARLVWVHPDTIARWTTGKGVLLRFADVGGEGRVEVAQALEADAVSVHHPGLGDLDEQQVELLEAVGGRGSQPSAIQACCGGCRVSCASAGGRYR